MTEESKKRMEKLPERFLNKLTFPNGIDGCWIWVAYKSKCGYGRIFWNGKPRLAHRLAHEIIIGKIPEYKQVNHICDTPACCNTNHFIIGNQAENARDMFKKGRAASQKGINNNKAKLTEKAVITIREEFKNRNILMGELAKRFDVSISTIERIISRKTWKHI